MDLNEPHEWRSRSALGAPGMVPEWCQDGESREASEVEGRQLGVTFQVTFESLHRKAKSHF